MSRDEGHLGRQYDVLMALAKRKSWGRGDLESTLQEITEAASHTMNIERVNIWLFDEERSKMRCVEHYQRSTGEHSCGVEIAAPGVSINSTVRGGGYGIKSGTSMACPHVSGAAALLKELHPTWSPSTIRARLRATADDLGVPGNDVEYGAGLLNCYRAVYG